MHRHLFDEDNFLLGHVILLENPFKLPQTGSRLCVLQRIDEQMDVMVHNRLIGSRGEPGAGPGCKALQARLREDAEAVVKEVTEKKLLRSGEDDPTFGLDGQPNREAVGKALQRRGETTAIALTQ